MTQEMSEITVEIFGKAYQIKCSEAEVVSLQRAAQLLEEQMVSMREKVQMLSSDKIMMAAALNISHQLLTLENKMLHESEAVQQRLIDLNIKIDKALSLQGQMELEPAE